MPDPCKNNAFAWSERGDSGCFSANQSNHDVTANISIRTCVQIQVQFHLFKETLAHRARHNICTIYTIQMYFSGFANAVTVTICSGSSSH